MAGNLLLSDNELLELEEIFLKLGKRDLARRTRWVLDFGYFCKDDDKSGCMQYIR